MKYNTVFFDLDGTLTDSREGIAKSVQYSLLDFGITVENLETLYKFIGPPLRGSYREFYGFSQEEAERAILKYRERFSTVGLFELEVYEGIYELLEQLKRQGRRLVLATSKPIVYAERIMERFRLKEYFDLMIGCELNGLRERKEDVIEYALSQAGITDKASVVMIGDRDYDVIGAAINGIDTVGVMYGFGSREELEKANAKYIVETVKELKELFLTI